MQVLHLLESSFFCEGVQIKKDFRKLTACHFTFSSQKTPLTHFEGHPQNRVTILLLAIICFRQVIGSNPIKYIYLQWFGTDKKISFFVWFIED